MILPILTIAAAAYLLGSVPAGYLLVRLFRHQDIRKSGSGNIGATNVLRSGGKGLAAGTFLVDVLKGSAAVGVGILVGKFLLPNVPVGNLEALAAVVAGLGHMFPVWLGFHGGKGVATGFGVFLVAAPWAALASITVFFLVVYFSRYVSLGSILGAASFPFFAWLLNGMLHGGDRPPLFIAAQFAVALLIVVKHHQNIGRLLAGTDSRFGAKKPA